MVTDGWVVLKGRSPPGSTAEMLIPPHDWLRRRPFVRGPFYPVNSRHCDIVVAGILATALTERWNDHDPTAQHDRL